MNILWENVVIQLIFIILLIFVVYLIIKLILVSLRKKRR